MDIQHGGDQLILALGGLIYCSDSMNVVFGIILEDGSISSDFRIICRQLSHLGHMA
jgi:hypothetical protein